jgi:hypothetical protein
MQLHVHHDQSRGSMVCYTIIYMYIHVHVHTVSGVICCIRMCRINFGTCVCVWIESLCYVIVGLHLILPKYCNSYSWKGDRDSERSEGCSGSLQETKGPAKIGSWGMI